MKCFKDGRGREWTINLTLGSAKRVYDKMVVDLLNPNFGTDEYVSIRLIRDDLFLCDVVSELIAPELEQKNVAKEDFLDSLDGETVARISDAFFEEYYNFFTARGREYVVEIVKADRTNYAKAGEEAIRKLREFLGESSARLQDDAELQTGET